MKTIHKYPLNEAAVTEVDTHQGVRWLTAQMQPDPDSPNGVMTVWAEVDTGASPTAVRLHVVGTGQPVPPGAHYIGTVQRGSRPWVFHIYAE